ncbi:unnamed protein product [Miscanthus lutarioriparius]|uniref:Uncharacterized protein n=1 Tax=Miscanthus lutarioriparius TaxID=422564 RepID=A0A811RP41_9POAL|nr:unnamed protein product [Miscanthus lutarioriparius]
MRGADLRSHGDGGSGLGSSGDQRWEQIVWRGRDWHSCSSALATGRHRSLALTWCGQWDGGWPGRGEAWAAAGSQHGERQEPVGLGASTVEDDWGLGLPHASRQCRT